MTKPYRIYIIAGEASGDNLGAKLIAALEEKAKEKGFEVAFDGIGGERMQAHGVKSLFPMEELSLIGFFEIIPHIPKLLRRIKQTVRHIIKIKPDMVVTIDSPGFNFRVVKAIKHLGIPLVHYVAPTVWAYKPERAIKVAALYDHLLTLLPFEPPYFEAEGLPCSFIGHPIIEDVSKKNKAKTFREIHHIDENTPIVALVPGSRKGELKRHIPIFKKVTERLLEQYPDLVVVMPSTASHLQQISNIAASWPSKVVVVDDDVEKQEALSACDLALAKSGTCTVELALMGVPMVVAYKVHPISAMMMRRMMQVPYVTLVNLLEGEEVIPEFLQEDCTDEKLYDAMMLLLKDSGKTTTQVMKSKHAMGKLGVGKRPKPSQKAAKVLLTLLEKQKRKVV